MTSPVLQSHTEDGLPRYAIFSPDHVYRYVLGWSLTPPGVGRGFLLWVLLNPSTADAFKLDPTLRRCAAYSRSWGYRGMKIVNLFAYRSTDPKGLLQVDDPVGPHNDLAITEAIKSCDGIVVAWGAHPIVKRLKRDEAVLKLLRPYRYRLRALRLTKSGAPSHPLYLPKNLTLIPYPT